MPRINEATRRVVRLMTSRARSGLERLTERDELLREREQDSLKDFIKLIEAGKRVIVFIATSGGGKLQKDDYLFHNLLEPMIEKITPVEELDDLTVVIERLDELTNLAQNVIAGSKLNARDCRLLRLTVDEVYLTATRHPSPCYVDW